MIDTLKQIVRMKTALWVNAFCFYFRKLWIVGKWMPETIYSRYGLKKALSIAALLARQLCDFLGKPVYLFLFAGLPLLLTADSRPELNGQEFLVLVNILFFLNCFLGSFGDSQIFTVTRDKVTCIKYLHMNARSYIQGCLVFKYVPFFLYYFPWLLVSARLLGAPLWQGFLLWLLLASFRMMGEAFQLLIFDYTGKVLSRSMVWQWAVIGVGLAGAYLPEAMGLMPFAGPVLLHPVCVAACAVLGAISLWYITAGYRGYEEKYHRSIDINFLLSSMLKASSGSASSFREVEVKEKDAAVPEKELARLSGLKGYAYLNALFFARNKRQLVKPLYYRLAVVAGILAAGVALYLTDRATAVTLSENITASLLPTFVFLMYCMTIADKACRSMFYNCDKDLLHFSYYRQPQVILENFRIRLKKVMQYNAVTAGAVCLAVVMFCIMCGTDIFTPDLLLFGVTVLLLSALFTAHHLCLYYIFQPYSESLQVKNPFYSVINVIIYSLCFLCLQIDVGGLAFTAAVLIFTILYIITVMILVWRVAPRTFRIK